MSVHGWARPHRQRAPPRQLAKRAAPLVIEVDRKPQGVGHRIVCSGVRIGRRPACTTGRCSPGKGRRAAPNQSEAWGDPPGVGGPRGGRSRHPPPPDRRRRGDGGRQEERRADGDGTPWSAGGPKTPQGCWLRTAGTPRRKPPTRTAGSFARTGSCPPGTPLGGEADAGGTGRSLRNTRPMPGITWGNPICGCRGTAGPSQRPG